MSALPPGFKHIALESAVSTNDETTKLLKQGAALGTVVTAKQQTGGRGRYGRAWVSEDGNLFASLILQPPGESFTWAQLGFVLSLAIAEALEPLLPKHKVELKWPNDMLVEGKKIAGILLEIRPDKNGKDALVAGFGINCISHPENADIEATDLKQQEAREMAPETILAAVLGAFQPLYDQWQEKGFAALRPGWLERAKNLNKQIAVRFGGNEIKGEFADIGSDDGALYINLADGETERIAAGDVYFGTNSLPLREGLGEGYANTSEPLTSQN